MTDIINALRELPPIPDWTAWGIMDRVRALEARLAECERLLRDSTTEGWCSCSTCEDARDYLEFRAKEQQT